MEQDFDRLRAIDRLEDGLDVIGLKGIAQLCSELNIAGGVNSLESFIVQWSIGAADFGVITRSEWLHAAHVHDLLHVHSLRDRSKTWQSLVREDATAFSEMYYYIYDFVRGEDKLLSIDRAVKVWQAVLTPDVFPLTQQWCSWCANDFRKPVSRDIWKQVLEFAKLMNMEKEAPKIRAIVAEVINGFDLSGKWPTAIDDFVQWVRDKNIVAKPKKATVAAAAPANSNDEGRNSPK